MPDELFRVERDCTSALRLLLKMYVDANPAVAECLRTGRPYPCRMAEDALRALQDAVWRARMEGCISRETAEDLFDEIALTGRAVEEARRRGAGK